VRQILTVNKPSALENETSCYSNIGCWSYLIVLTLCRNGRRRSVQAKRVSYVFGSDSACAVKFLFMFLYIVQSLKTNTRVWFLYVPVFPTGCIELFSKANKCTWMYESSFKFKVCKSVHHHTFQMNQPTRRNNFSSLLLDVYVQLNMFRASSRPSSGPQQLQ
jgi:hypothetical protein